MFPEPQGVLTERNHFLDLRGPFGPPVMRFGAFWAFAFRAILARIFCVFVRVISFTDVPLVHFSMQSSTCIAHSEGLNPHLLLRSSPTFVGWGVPDASQASTSMTPAIIPGSIIQGK